MNNVFLLVSELDGVGKVVNVNSHLFCIVFKHLVNSNANNIEPICSRKA